MPRSTEQPSQPQEVEGSVMATLCVVSTSCRRQHPYHRRFRTPSIHTASCHQTHLWPYRNLCIAVLAAESALMYSCACGVHPSTPPPRDARVCEGEGLQERKGCVGRVVRVFIARRPGGHEHHFVHIYLLVQGEMTHSQTQFTQLQGFILSCRLTRFSC